MTDLAIKEDDILVAYMDWVAIKKVADPRYGYIVHIPNEGKRNWWSGKKLIRKGLSRGLNDVLNFFPVGDFRGFVIEFKSQSGNLTKEQITWLDKFTAIGWACTVIRSTQAAIFFTESYFDNELKHPSS